MKRQLWLVAVVVALAANLAVAGCQQMCRRCGHVVKVDVLEGIHFDFNKYMIKPEGRIILDKDVLLLKKDKTLDISIEGHCDIVGSDEYNQQLSERRAKTVYDYFASNGIDPSRMKTVGWGRTRPVVPNTTEANRARNRRVEIVIIKARP